MIEFYYEIHQISPKISQEEEMEFSEPLPSSDWAVLVAILRFYNFVVYQINVENLR